MADSGPGSGPGLLRYFKPWQHIDLLDYLAHFYIQVAHQGWVPNYSILIVDMETLNPTSLFEFFH